MWLNWTDLDRHFAALEAFRRQAERTWRPDGRGGVDRDFSSWSDARVEDDGDAYTFAVDLPGVTEDGLDIELEDRTLTVSARRAIDVPEGHAVVRSERLAFDWKKSVTLPGRVDAEKTVARLEDGVLKLRLEKLPEHKPRRISVG